MHHPLPPLYPYLSIVFVSQVEKREGRGVYPRVKESKILNTNVSLFFSLFLLPILFHPCISRWWENRQTSTFADTQVHHEEEGACQVVAGPPLAGWLAGWLPRHSSVNFNVLCHDLSRVSARLSLMLRSIFSPALHPHTRSFRSFTRSLSLFREGLISLLSRIQCGKWTEFAKLGDPDSADSPPQRS